MDKYIKADELEKFLCDTRREMKPENYTSADAFHTMDGALLNVEQVVRLMEGADVVEVVRCKDCRYMLQSEGCALNRDRFRREEEDYCSYGEREDA